jgi:hypothetical protein
MHRLQAKKLTRETKNKKAASLPRQSQSHKIMMGAAIIHIIIVVISSFSQQANLEAQSSGSA